MTRGHTAPFPTHKLLASWKTLLSSYGAPQVTFYHLFTCTSRKIPSPLTDKSLGKKLKKIYTNALLDLSPVYTEMY